MAAKSKVKEVSMEEALWKSVDKLRGSVFDYEPMVSMVAEGSGTIRGVKKEE